MSQLHTGGSKKSKGTRKRQQKGAGRGAKAPRLEVPPQATEPTTHLPPDAEQDLASSIRSALSGGLHALSEQAWLQDEGTVSLQPLSQQESSDSSERSSPAEWMSSDTTRTHEEALDKPTLTGMRPVMPSSSRGHRQEAKREKRKMPGAAAGGRPDAGYGPSSEPSTSQGVSASETMQADNSLRRLLDAYRWLRRMFREMPEHVLRTHPFYHHPERQLRLSNKVVSVENIKKSIVSRQKAISVLVDIRAVLRKQFLTAQEYETLVSYTERLCGYACGTMSTNINTKAGTQILGRMFIILDTLHCAAEALGMGANRAAWWPVIINRIESRAPSRDPEEASWLSPINHALTIAIEYYKRGLRPPMGLVIGLKLILFVSPKLTDFKELKWDPWRDDALHWFEAVAMRIQHSEQSRKDSEGRR
ncbi:hypothetical protein EBH_0036130 [Eimeria brunetti]|uniref:Uncharacterized protein n=1 Tax=Eimeria brunetti TaxID=51314 RepID=U6LDE9_9EIME|nr:hypothetical protein EBH_0036130 [Eimeria brunetti]